jgi:hypothetical protein
MSTNEHEAFVTPLQNHDLAAKSAKDAPLFSFAFLASSQFLGSGRLTAGRLRFAGHRCADGDRQAGELAVV